MHQTAKLEGKFYLLEFGLSNMVNEHTLSKTYHLVIFFKDPREQN